MVRHVSLLVLVAAAIVATAPASAQLQEDGARSTQARLPQGLRQSKIGVNEARGLFTATHPPAVRALAGRTLTLPGFLMPLDAATKGTHFLLSKYTPVCAFCPPGEPNEGA